MIETEAATEEEPRDLGPDPAPATAGEMAEETIAGDILLAQAPETDAAAAAEANLVVAAVAVTTGEEADLLTRREAPLRMTEGTTLCPQVTTSERDL